MAVSEDRERVAKKRAPPGKHLRPSEAAELLAQHARSGKTLHDFAKALGRSTRSLSYWKTRFAREGTPRAQPAPAAPPAPRRPAPGPTFVPVRVQPTASVARSPEAGTRVGATFALTLRDGGRLDVPADFEGAALQRLLVTLREVGAW